MDKDALHKKKMALIADLVAQPFFECMPLCNIRQPPVEQCSDHLPEQWPSLPALSCASGQIGLTTSAPRDFKDKILVIMEADSVCLPVQAPLGHPDTATVL